MPYDDQLAARVRDAPAEIESARTTGWTEKRMFGGLAFLIAGQMVCGAARDALMVRVGPERHEQALQQPAARPMDFTGRPMRGYVYVDAADCDDAALAEWITRAADFVTRLT